VLKINNFNGCFLAFAGCFAGRVDRDGDGGDRDGDGSPGVSIVMDMVEERVDRDGDGGVIELSGGGGLDERDELGTLFIDAQGISTFFFFGETLQHSEETDGDDLFKKS